MKITAIKEQVKNPHRVSVFIDGKYTFSLTLEQLLEEKLKKDMDIDDPELTRLKRLSDEGKLKVKALDWLMMRPHSTREFRDYAFRKKIEKDLLEVWIAEFTAKKYIDDHYFAQWFADNRMRKNKSKRFIVAELRSKGIAQDVAQQVVDNQGSDDEDALRQLVSKLRSKPRYQDEKKLIAHLLGKGFRYDTIKEALKPQQ